MPRFRTGKRRTKRTRAVMPVRLLTAGSEDIHLAHTLDVTNQGVQLGGYRGEMKVGDEIVIQYRRNQAQFRVIWITARENLEIQDPGTVYTAPDGRMFVFVVDKTTSIPLWIQV